MNCEPQLSETYHPSTHFVQLIIVEILIREVPAGEMPQRGKTVHVIRFI